MRDTSGVDLYFDSMICIKRNNVTEYRLFVEDTKADPGETDSSPADFERAIIATGM